VVALLVLAAYPPLPAADSPGKTSSLGIIPDDRVSHPLVHPRRVTQ